MASHSSATLREPHANQITRTSTIVNALKQRAEAVLNDTSLDAQSRAIIRYALETHDPWLARLVHRAEAGEDVVENLQSNEATEEKIEALAEMICRAGEESAAALLVLMGMLENSTNPKALANAAKHFAFTRCGQSNLYGMVDAQIAVIENDLF